MPFVVRRSINMINNRNISIIMDHIRIFQSTAIVTINRRYKYDHPRSLPLIWYQIETNRIYLLRKSPSEVGCLLGVITGDFKVSDRPKAFSFSPGEVTGDLLGTAIYKL